MIKYKEFYLKAAGVQSLCWYDSKLYDWVSGGIVYSLDGNIQESFRQYGYRFDSAIMSPSGDFAVIYERLGTKALVLHHGKILRELNRSFYDAEVYDYPVAFAQLATGQEVLIHCPQDYCRLDIEDVLTGECLTNSPERKPVDLFHSCLSSSPNGRWLLSAGWVWHPFECVHLYDLKVALSNSVELDKSFYPCTINEAYAASFNLNNELIIVTSAENNNDMDVEDSNLCAQRGVIASFLPEQQCYKRQVLAEETVGRCVALGDDYLLGFYEHPKLFQISTGKVIQRWEHLTTGKHTGSISWHLDKLAVFAVDPIHSRFAVADGQGITVVELEF